MEVNMDAYQETRYQVRYYVPTYICTGSTYKLYILYIPDDLYLLYKHGVHTVKYILYIPSNLYILYILYMLYIQ